MPRSPSRVSSPSGQGGDEAVGLRGAQRRPHLLVGHVGPEGDVAADGVVEEERLLGHEGGVLGQLARGEVAQVLTVDRDAPAVGVDEAEQQGGQGALAGGGGADERDGAAGLDGERDVLEDRLLGVVGEADVVRPPARAPRPGVGEARVAVLHLAGLARAPSGPGRSRRRCAGTRRAASRGSGSGTRPP